MPCIIYPLSQGLSLRDGAFQQMDGGNSLEQTTAWRWRAMAGALFTFLSITFHDSLSSFTF